MSSFLAEIGKGSILVSVITSSQMILARARFSPYSSKTSTRHHTNHKDSDSLFSPSNSPITELRMHASEKIQFTLQVRLEYN
jgi:hypothetical protein